MQICPNNLLDIDSLIEKFLQEHAIGIATLHRNYFHNNDELSLRALKAEVVDELRTGCVSFINKDYPLEKINSYLFYIVNDFCKKTAKPQIKNKTEYLCPCCLFLGKENKINLSNQILNCFSCQDEIKITADPKKIALFSMFSKHNKMGYHCQDCKRFIPHPLDELQIISCPYFDCCFVGELTSLKRMHHPISQSNPEKLMLDAEQNVNCFKNILVASESNFLSQIHVKKEQENRIEILSDVIDSQKNSVPYVSSDFTSRHKSLTYQAFANLLIKYPEQMADYLLSESRSGGFQHKVFQEYIRLLEASIPFSYKKNKKYFKVESLLDDNLNLFDGISTFDAIVSENLVVKNGTQEFYIGGRKARIAKPYYIGKLLNVIDKVSQTPIMDHVKEYSFSRIKVRDIEPGTEVTVMHLRVPPHYQMKGMVCVNRIRKKIVGHAQFLLNNECDRGVNQN
jgi:hypothetical protein